MQPIEKQQTTRFSLKEISIIIGLFTGVFVVGADSFILSPLLPAIKDTFNTSLSNVAFAITIYALCYAVGSPFFGPLGDQFNKRRLLMTGVIIFLAGTFLCGTAQSLTAFYIYRAIAGIGASLFVPNVWAFIGSFFSDGKMSMAMGITLSALSLSIAIGVPLGTALSQLGDWHMAFWGSGILTLLSAGILFCTIPDVEAERSRPFNYMNHFKTVALTPRAVPALLITLAWMFGFYSFYTFLGTFVQTNYHFSTAETGYVFIAYGVGNFLASFFGGLITNRLGAKRSIMIHGLLSAACMMLTALLGGGLTVLVILLLLLAIAQGFGVTSLNSYIVNIVPSNRSTVMAFNSSFLYLGLTAGSLVGGILYNQSGFTLVCFASAIGISLAITLTLVLQREQKDNKK